MPTSSFTRGALRGGLTGLSRLAQVVAGGDQIEQDAFDKTALNQSRIGQAVAAAAKADAEAAQLRAETEAFNNRGGLWDQTIAANAGATIPQLRMFEEFQRTGTLPQVELAGPPSAEGTGPGMAPALDEPTRSRIALAVGRYGPLRGNLNDLNPEQFAKAQSTYRNMGLGDDVIAGRLPAATVGRSQAAVGGNPLYSSDASGARLDLFTGDLDTNNPMAQSSIALKGAQAGALRANAVQSYAAADNSRASAARTRAAMAEERGAGARAPAGYRWTSNGGLEPIPGGPADPSRAGAKQVKPPTEGQAKALAFASRMQVADDVLTELAADGKLLPNLVKQGVESVPLIGGALGMGANAFSSESEQQIEQAQRDFINAVLRRESGAVITKGEFANARQQYFPQPGDSPAVLAQKAINRQTAIKGFKAEFGEQGVPQFDEIVGAARAARKAAKQPKQPAAAPRPATAASSQRNIQVDY